MWYASTVHQQCIATQPPWPDQMWAAATEYSSDVLREC